MHTWSNSGFAFDYQKLKKRCCISSVGVDIDSTFKILQILRVSVLIILRVSILIMTMQRDYFPWNSCLFTIVRSQFLHFNTKIIYQNPSYFLRLYRRHRKYMYILMFMKLLLNIYF